ncbi:c-type cytochrome [uncultured Hymenobacter sp.]|uniref:c-type cytochrome n=1 Tax=uncultured Hymenobacter sp. TaxID=170016 RepID=UPI0035CAFF94
MSFSALLLRLHLLVLLAFLLFYAIKAALLFSSRQETLRNLRARTRIVDSLLGLLILGSGIWLVAQYPGAAPRWLWVELGLAVVLLPLAIAAMRRQYKLGVACTLLGLLYLYGVAQAGSLTLRRPTRPVASTAALGRPETTPTPDAAPPIDTLADDEPGLSEAEADALKSATVSAALASPPAEPENDGEDILADGKALFNNNCAACHGADGRLGLNGAHDLSKSNLNTTGRVYMVTQGLGKMPSFKDKLTTAQIQHIVAYSLTLK